MPTTNISASKLFKHFEKHLQQRSIAVVDVFMSMQIFRSTLVSYTKIIS